MQKRVAIFLPTAVIFVVLSLLIATSGQAASNAISRFGIEQTGLLLQRFFFSVSSPFFSSGNQKDEKTLAVLSEKSEKAAEQREMQALRDQFETTTVVTATLLPAKIIGFEGFLPGVSRPTGIVLDLGSRNGVKSGLAVVYKNNLVGKIGKVTQDRSQVILLSKSGWSFTAKTTESDANGLVAVENGDIFLKNVVLSDKISKKDIVVTKGDMTLSGSGFPPDIVVGEVSSVEKKASSLFQTAKVQSFVDVTHLTTVFIFLPK